MVFVFFRSLALIANMARTSIVNGKRVRPKVTAAVKRARRDRFEALATDLTQAQQAYAKEAQDIAKKYDR